MVAKPNPVKDARYAAEGVMFRCESKARVMVDFYTNDGTCIAKGRKEQPELMQSYSAIGNGVPIHSVTVRSAQAGAEESGEKHCTVPYQDDGTRTIMNAGNNP